MTESIKSIDATVTAAAVGPFGVSAAATAAVAPVASVAAGVSSTTDDDANVDPQALRQAVHDAVAQLLDRGVELSYRVDSELDRVVVEVRDRADGTVLRQIPGEEVLRLARRLQDSSGGLLQATA